MKYRAEISCTIQLGSISSLRCQKSRTLLSIQTSRCEVMFRGRRLSTCKHCVGDQTIWWSQTGSNRRPHACKARALPAELWPRNQKTKRLSSPASPFGLCRTRFASSSCMAVPRESQRRSVVGLGRLELPTSRLSSARSNQLSYKPLTLSFSGLGSCVRTPATSAECIRTAQPRRVFVREERETKTAKSRQCSSTIWRSVGH